MPNRALQTVQNAIQFFGLGQAAGKSVEHKSILYILPAHAFLDHRDRYFVRNQRAAVGVFFYFLAESSTVFDVIAEHVAGRNMWDCEQLNQARGLCSFA